MLVLKEGELVKRIQDMEVLLELMNEKYGEMKRDREVLERAIAELKEENAKLKGESNGRT